LDGQYLDPESVKPIIESLVTQDMDDGEKADIIYDWVLENVQYGYEELLKTDDPYRLRSVEECVAQGEGNCLEQSLVWLSLAKAAGIENAYLVEERTVFPSPYHHYLVAVDDETDGIYGYDVTFKLRHAAQPSYARWRLRDPEKVARGLERHPALGVPLVQNLVNHPAVPLRATSYTKGSFTVHEFHHLFRDRDGDSHMSMSFLYRGPKGRVTEVFDVKYDNEIHEPASATYYIAEKRPVLPFIEIDFPVKRASVSWGDGELVISGDSMAEGRVRDLAFKAEGLPFIDVELGDDAPWWHSSTGNVLIPVLIEYFDRCWALSEDA